MSNFKHRGIYVDGLYERCSVEEETVAHALWQGVNDHDACKHNNLFLAGML